MSSNVISILTLSQSKAQKLKISNCRHACDFTLFPVHLEFKLLLKVFPAGFKQTLCRSLTPGEYHYVIGVTDNRNTSCFHLLIKFIQVDVCEQRTKWSSSAFITLSFLLPFFGLTIIRPFPFSHGTIASADFSQFVVTTLTFECRLLVNACETSPGTHTLFLSIYLPHLLQMIPCSYWASTWFGALPSFTA